MYATCITERIHLNVISPSAEAHILKMGGPETPFFQANNISFSAVPPPLCLPFFTTPFTCGYHWTENVFVYSAFAGLSQDMLGSNRPHPPTGSREARVVGVRSEAWVQMEHLPFLVF